MRLLIRYLKKHGESEVTEQVFVEGNNLDIGRGTNQSILLPDQRVALSHAKITVSNGEIKAVSLSGKYILHNDKMVTRAKINIGDTIDISGHQISVLAGDKECDFIFQVKINSLIQESIKERFQTRLQDLNLRKRRWSWLFFIAVLIFCLLLPLSGLFNPALMESLRQNPLPDDSHWMAGDLMKPHKFIGDDCSACHVDAFTPAGNEQCQTCHSQVKSHSNNEDETSFKHDFNQCTDCHKEHNPEETLSQYSQKMCISCHEDNISHGNDKEKYRSVNDFDNHPNFKISMLSPILVENKVIDWQTNRHSLSDLKVSEESNLNFSHQLHMDPEGLKSVEGKEILECANCHQAEKGGLKMKPITMEKNCQSCHLLAFDAQDPERVVPHGSPKEVVLMMREYYAFRYIYQYLNKDNEQNIKKAGELFSVREARRPGRSESLLKKLEESDNAATLFAIEKLTKQTVRSDALVWAETRANSAAINLFERQACDICHQVTKNVEEEVPWHVKPVALTENWLPLSQFTHGKHESMTCNNCHNAEDSELSSDILIPDIDNCQQCHGGEESTNLIPNTCVDCHGFHEAKDLLFDGSLKNKSKTLVDNLRENNEK
jgi:predicted CXXCH cytochrome family protein